MLSRFCYLVYQKTSIHLATYERSITLAHGVA